MLSIRAVRSFWLTTTPCSSMLSLKLAALKRSSAPAPLLVRKFARGADSCHSLVLLRQKQRGCRSVCFSDDPQPLPGVCPVAAQQSKPMSHAVLIFRDIGWLQFAPVPD